jgi:hypothetical protein
MTKLLEEVLEHLRELTEEEQDAAARVLFAYIESDERDYALQPYQVAEVRHIRARLHAGMTQLATSRDVTAVRKKSDQ